MKRGLIILLALVHVICGFSQSDYWNYFDVSNNGLNGIKCNDKIVVPCEYTNKYLAYLLKKMNNGYIIVSKGGTLTNEANERVMNGKWGMIDINNNTIIPFEYDAILMPTEDLAAVCKGGEKVYDPYYNGGVNYQGGKWGYFDIKTGKLIVPLQYDSAEPFTDGVAMVSNNGVTTLINNPLSTENNLGNVLATQISDVDTDIPVSNKSSENVFAFICTVENYNEGITNPSSLNDGKIIKEYINKTIGVPERNISYYENGTFANLHAIKKRMIDIASVYENDAQFIVYFSGLGFTNQADRQMYLLPSDASLSNLSATSYKLSDLYEGLPPIKSCLIIVDASFDGKDRNEKSFLKGRGVAIKAKNDVPHNNTVVLCGSSEEGTSYNDKTMTHGLFTYYLLKKIKEDKGDVSVKDLFDYSSKQVSKYCIEKGLSVIQKPQILSDNIKLTNIKLK